jgi:signal transduction histidine kinase
VIGGAVLLIGLLLILAGLAAARIPGGATFTPSGISASPESDTTEDARSGPSGTVGVGPFALVRRARNPLRAFLLSPIHPATWYANAGVLLGFFVGVFAFAIIASLASAGFATILAGIGVLFIAFGIEASRVVARIERWRAFLGEPVRPAAHPYRPLRGGVTDILRGEFADESRWRDVLYIGVNLPLSIIELLVIGTVWGLALWLVTAPIWLDAQGGSMPSWLGIIGDPGPMSAIARPVIGALLLPVAASLSQLVAALHRAVVAGLLCTSESRELRRQVQTLKESRSAVLDVEASELHRIERDLHDGAQQRLVMLTIDLGLASERLDTDPAGARQLILDGQGQARQALAEIRNLVRGIAPSILLDRGLVAALESISAGGPVPTAVRSELAPGERLPAAIERAAYFVATEALANVAKHSRANHAEVRCRRDADRFVVEVWDDGVGGASVAAGGGLEGLARRVAGVDGAFSVSSPAGGPTLIRAEFPMTQASQPAEPVSYWVRPRS